MINIKYTITNTVVDTLKKYDWLKNQIKLGEIGSKDDREIIRLLENPNETQKKLLNLINNNAAGSVSNPIRKKIINQTDKIQFRRTLSELYLFYHLFDKLGNKVGLPTKSRSTIPDLIISDDKIKIPIEIYTPMDIYGFQLFENYLTSIINYLPSNFGYIVQINVESDNLGYPINFPIEIDVIKWLEEFQTETLQFITNAKIVGETYTKCISGDSIKVNIVIIDRLSYSNQRYVRCDWASRSNDFRYLFEDINYQHLVSSNWCKNLKNKLQKQQAGPINPSNIRILAINFQHVDTADIWTFLSDKQYCKNLKNAVIEISKNVKPYPPYDIVLPCIMDFDCGFANPIILSNHNSEEIYKLLQNNYLDTQISNPYQSMVETIS